MIYHIRCFNFNNARYDTTNKSIIIGHYRLYLSFNKNSMIRIPFLCLRNNKDAETVYLYDYREESDTISIISNTSYLRVTNKSLQFQNPLKKYIPMDQILWLFDVNGVKNDGFITVPMS